MNDKKYVLGLENILLEVLSINDVAYTGTAITAYASAFSSAASANQSVGEVAEGSTQFNDEDPTETSYKGDYNDASLLTLFQRGDISVETDIIEVNKEKFALLTGGSVSGNKITIPASSPKIEAKVTLKFKAGFTSVVMPKANIVATYTGANLKTEMFKLHLKAIAVPTDVSGNSILAEITTT